MPGYRSVAVDSMGRVLGDDGELAGQPGDTLVTSIDAKVQGVVEKQLAATIATARRTHDEVSGRNYVADSGAAVVIEANTGRVVAMASQPTYDPEGLGRRHHREAAASGSTPTKAGTPLLSRATQGQFAPGSTWKPFMTAGALTNGFTTDTRLNCSSGFQVGNRVFKNYESGAYGYIGFDQGPQGLVQHLLLPRRLRLLAAVRHRRRRRRRQGPAGLGGPGPSASAARPASTCPARPPAGSPTGSWKLAYYKSHEGLLLRHRRQAAGRQDERLRLQASPTSSASRATPTAPATP